MVEYLLKLIAGLLNQKEPDSMENFFEGLTKENPNQSNLCEYLEQKCPAYTQYLKDSWNSWIKPLNKYRTDTMHKSIKIRPKTTVTTYFDKGEQKPEKMEISGIQFQEQDILKYVEDLDKNLIGFITEGLVLIQNKLCK